MRIKIPVLVIIITLLLSSIALAITSSLSAKVNQVNRIFCPEINEGLISADEIIYSDAKLMDSGGLMWMESVTYTYLGVEDYALKIKSEKYNSLFSDASEENILVLPVNENNQALLEINASKNLVKAELMLTLVDEFNRIKAERYIHKELPVQKELSL